MKSPKLYYLALVLLVAVVYWQWFLPGSKVANDFPLVSGEYLRSMLDLPRIWLDRAGEGLGFNAIFSLWSYPASLLMGLLANANLNFEVLERLFFILPFIFLGSFSIWKFLGHFKISNEGRFLSSIFYLANTYIILLIDGGQLLIVLAYAFFPLCFLAVEKAVFSSFYSKVLASAAVVLLGFLDIRFIFVLFLLLVLRIFYGVMYQNNIERVNWVKQWIIMGLIAVVMLLGFNAFWLVPYILFPPNQEVFGKLTQVSEGSAVNIGHSILLISPHWYKNIFGNISSLKVEFFLIPLLVFLSPVIRKRNYFTGFWLLIALVSIFLSKGGGEPFSKLYGFLFSNVPGFSLFRDSTKFFFLTAISYTFLIGVTLEWLLGKFKSIKFKALVSLFFVAYLLFLIRPVFLNQMTGTLSVNKETREFAEIADVLEKDKTFSRTFWIPATLPLSYSTPTHPIVEALRLSEKRPFASGTKGTYEILNFLREAPYMGELFDVSAIGYIVYPFPSRENLHPDEVKYYQTFWNQLTKLAWLEERSGLPVLRVKNHQDKFFVAENIWFVVGSDEIYNEATKAAELSLKSNALIFTEETAGLGKKLVEFPSSNIVLYKKSNTDLASSFIDSDYLIFPAKELSKDPDSSGWWKRETKDLLNWRYFLKTKYAIDNQDFDLGGGWAVGEESLKFKVKSEKFKKGKVLLGRVMESSRSGHLSFYQGEYLVGTIKTKAEDTNVRWFEVGVLNNDTNEVVVQSEGAINVINALAALPSEKWEDYLNKAKSFEKRIKTFTPENAEVGSAKVFYKEINPTKYRIDITGLSKEGLAVFSSAYDDLWKLDNKSSLPIYSLLNGFRVQKDGTYEISFAPQEKIVPAVAISSLFLIITLGYLMLWRRIKK